MLAFGLVGCTPEAAPQPAPSSTAPSLPPAPVVDIANWFGEIPGYSAFDLSTGVPSQPIFLRERGAVESSALDGTRARAVNYESLTEAVGLVRQGFTATALFIATPADEASQVDAVAELVSDTGSMPEGWESTSVETQTIGAHEFFVLDSIQSLNGTTTNTRSWVAVVGSYLVTVTFDWATADEVPSAVTPVYSLDEVEAQNGMVESLIATIP